MRSTYLIISLLIISCSSLTKEKNVENINVDFNKMWNYSDPAGTREKFKDLLVNCENKNLDYILQLKTQIARTHSLKAEFGEAHNILNEVEEKLNDETIVAKIRYFLERGRTYNSANEKDKAKTLFVSAFDLSNEFELDNYAIDAAHMVAIAENDLDDKILWSEKGIDIAKNSSDDKVKRWIGMFYNNTGWDLFEAKRYDEALEKFLNCRSFHMEMGNKSNEDIARWSIAKTYRLLGKLEDSLKIQEDLLTESNGTDESGYTYEELAELYFLMGQKDIAKDYFSKAYDVLSKDVWLQKNESARLERLSKLSK